MTELELKILNDFAGEKKQILSAKDLLNQEDRTLLYGYSSDRVTHHVYLKNKQIYAITYNIGYFRENSLYRPVNIIKKTINNNSEFVPDKRLYPHACDYEFCVLLKRKGINLPFTAMDHKEPPRKYYGFLLKEHES